MTEPVKTVNIGGVEYLASQVKESSKYDKIYADASGNLKSKSVFDVELADGTELSYEEQAPEREARVLKEEASTEFFGLEKATITDTPEDDIYILYGCNNCEVKADRVHTEGIIFKDVVSNDKDYIDVSHRKMNDGTIQASKNNLISISIKDTYLDFTRETGNFGNKLNIVQ